MKMGLMLLAAAATLGTARQRFPRRLRRSAIIIMTAIIAAIIMTGTATIGATIAVGAGIIATAIATIIIAEPAGDRRGRAATSGPSAMSSRTISRDRETP